MSPNLWLVAPSQPRSETCCLQQDQYCESYVSMRRMSKLRQAYLIMLDNLPRMPEADHSLRLGPRYGFENSTILAIPGLLGCGRVCRLRDRDIGFALSLYCMRFSCRSVYRGRR